MTTPERIEALPDLQTTAEAGLPDIEVGVWHGLYVPAETPDEVVKALTDALAKALEDPTVIDKFADLGTAPVPDGRGDAGGAHGAARRSRSSSGARSSRKPASRGHDGGLTPAAAGMQPDGGSPTRGGSVLDDLVAGGIFVAFGPGVRDRRARLRARHRVPHGAWLRAARPRRRARAARARHDRRRRGRWRPRDERRRAPPGAVPWRAIALIIAAVLVFGAGVDAARARPGAARRRRSSPPSPIGATRSCACRGDRGRADGALRR